MREAERGAIVVKGNHDAAIGELAETMNPTATQAIAWTRGQLDPAQKAFLAGLPLTVPEGDVLWVHANGWNPGDWGYVRSEIEAERSLRATRAQITLCGHTHVPALYHMSPMRPPVAFSPPPGKPVPLSRSRRWLAVLGAVGQPRDGNPAALLRHVRSVSAGTGLHPRPLRRGGGRSQDPRSRAPREPRGAAVLGR